MIINSEKDDVMSETELEVQESYRTVFPELGLYIDTKVYSAGQLQVIRYGLEVGLNVSSYVDPNFSVEEMTTKFYELRSALMKSKSTLQKEI